MSIRNARGELLEPQQASASCAALMSQARDCAQELPFCGAVQGQYIVWERTVYAQTPIDKLPQASAVSAYSHLTPSRCAPHA